MPTFSFFAYLDSPSGPVTFDSRPYSTTVTDTADGNNNGITAIGDLIDTGLSHVPLLATTSDGIVVSGGPGVFILYSYGSYTEGQSLSGFNSISAYPYCFLAGTMIATPSGDVPVEYLKIGDDVLVSDGRTIAVKWIGEQRVKNWMFTPDALLPVCIAKGALGGGLPHADLLVSADHGILVDDMVINASALVNGSTVRFVPMAELGEAFTYYHIETEAHDVILANGAAAETFFDAAGRGSFDNRDQYIKLYGAERIIPEMDRPRITSSRLVPQAIKDRLAPATDWDAALDDPGMVVSLSRGAG